MDSQLQYKCPSCGGSIEFDAESQNLKCPYCDTEFEPETLAAYDEQLRETKEDQTRWDTVSENTWSEEEAAGMAVYGCRSCGGEIAADTTTGATHCPWCGSPVVLMGQFAGSRKPDLVIPFQLDKEAAKAALRNHYKGKPLLPKVFKDENHIDEIKGIYVPFWIFDTDAKASIRYKATRIRTWSDANYYYTETRYFAVRRGGSLGFEYVPVDGSSKMEDALMESIEPFDPSKAVPFHTGYLSGYLADKYDVDSQQSAERANARIRQSTADAFARTVQGYTTVIPEATSIVLDNGTARYALYPVWMLNTTWNGKKYTFAVNGQTGKMAGDLPMDKGAFKKWFFGLTAAVGAAAFALSYLIWLL